MIRLFIGIKPAAATVISVITKVRGDVLCTVPSICKPIVLFQAYI